jgi:hypothetical protein
MRNNIWDKETSPLNLHDAFCVNPYPPVDGNEPQERIEQLLTRQEVMLRQMNLNLARLNELQDKTNNVANYILGVGVLLALLALFG